MPTAITIVLLCLAAAILVFVCGPRPKLNLDLKNSPIPSELSALDDWLLQQEEVHGDITEGTGKSIVWATPEQPQKTDTAILYLHGFSATRKEIEPVPQQLAKILNANLYLTRMPGHGLGYRGLENIDATDWLQEALDSYRLSEKIGKKVIVMGTSTGATIALWLAHQEKLKKTLDRLILISPNFELFDYKSKLLNMPWSETLLPELMGHHYGDHNDNELVERYWTNRYPIQALIEMYKLVSWVKGKDASQLKTPALFLYSERDDVVAHQAIGAMIKTWGGPTKQQLMDGREETSLHVIAGDIMNPQNNSDALKISAAFSRQNFL